MMKPLKVLWEDSLENQKNVVVLVTCLEEQAQEIASALVEQRKAACVNIIKGVISIFRWRGTLESDRESLLVIKSRASLLDEIIALVKQVHSYDVPEIIALPIIGGNKEYLDWIDSEVE
jgi:periplasmic divalent cation tolerance protein